MVCPCICLADEAALPVQEQAAHQGEQCSTRQELTAVVVGQQHACLAALAGCRLKVCGIACPGYEQGILSSPRVKGSVTRDTGWQQIYGCSYGLCCKCISSHSLSSRCPRVCGAEMALWSTSCGVLCCSAGPAVSFSWCTHQGSSLAFGSGWLGTAALAAASLSSTEAGQLPCASIRQYALHQWHLQRHSGCISDFEVYA